MALLAITPEVRLQVGDEFTASATQQAQQVQALQVLEAVLKSGQFTESKALEGLQVRLYHPDVAHFDMTEVTCDDSTSMQVAACTTIHLLYLLAFAILASGPLWSEYAST